MREAYFCSIWMQRICEADCWAWSGRFNLDFWLVSACWSTFMSYVWYLLFNAAEDQKAVERKCVRQQRAYEVCVNANLGKPENCRDLSVMLTHCLAERVKPEAAAAFDECVQESFANDKTVWAPNACDKQVEAMQQALKKVSLFPLTARQDRKQRQ